MAAEIPLFGNSVFLIPQKSQNWQVKAIKKRVVQALSCINRINKSEKNKTK